MSFSESAKDRVKDNILYRNEYDTIKRDMNNGSLLLSSTAHDLARMNQSCSKLLGVFRREYPRSVPFITIKIVPMKENYKGEPFKYTIRSGDEIKVVEEKINVFDAREIKSKPMTKRELNDLRVGKKPKCKIIQTSTAKSTARIVVSDEPVQITELQFQPSNLHISGLISDNIYNVLIDEADLLPTAAIDTTILDRLQPIVMERIERPEFKRSRCKPVTELIKDNKQLINDNKELVGDMDKIAIENHKKQTKLEDQIYLTDKLMNDLNDSKTHVEFLKEQKTQLSEKCVELNGLRDKLHVLLEKLGHQSSDQKDSQVMLDTLDKITQFRDVLESQFKNDKLLSKIYEKELKRGTSFFDSVIKTVIKIGKIITMIPMDQRTRSKVMESIS